MQGRDSHAQLVGCKRHIRGRVANLRPSFPTRGNQKRCLNMLLLVYCPVRGVKSSLNSKARGLLNETDRTM